MYLIILTLDQGPRLILKIIESGLLALTYDVCLVVVVIVIIVVELMYLLKLAIPR
jgi:hypothetical protein